VAAALGRRYVDVPARLFGDWKDEIMFGDGTVTVRTVERLPLLDAEGIPIQSNFRLTMSARLIWFKLRPITYDMTSSG
jgi:hypothetical protein